MKSFVDTMFNAYFYPCTHKVTRVGKSSATVIDSIWTNDIKSNKTNGILITDSSDHFSPFVILENLNNMSHPKSITITYRDFNHSSEDEVRRRLDATLANLTFTNDVNHDFEVLGVALVEVFNASYPIKSKTISNKSILKPWFNNELHNLVKQRQRLQRKFTNHPITYGVEYRRFRNYVNNKLKEDKQNYYNQKFNDAIGSSKQTWKILGNILNNKTNRNHIIKKNSILMVNQLKSQMKYQKNLTTSSLI